LVIIDSSHYILSRELSFARLDTEVKVAVDPLVVDGDPLSGSAEQYWLSGVVHDRLGYFGPVAASMFMSALYASIKMMDAWSFLLCLPLRLIGNRTSVSCTITLHSLMYLSLNSLTRLTRFYKEALSFGKNVHVFPLREQTG